MPGQRLTQIEHSINTICAIVSSPNVQHFVIGITSQRIWDRRAAYYVKGAKHLVIFADKLAEEYALDVEADIQAICKSGQIKVLKRKYHPSYKFGRRSKGGPRLPLNETYSVYMAWWVREAKPKVVSKEMT